MFLAKPSPWTGTAPTYLVAGDKIIWLTDKISIQSFVKVGLSIVPLSVSEMADMVAKLDPNLEHPLAYLADNDDAASTLIDGGAPNTVLFAHTYDGGNFTDPDDGVAIVGEDIDG